MFKKAFLLAALLVLCSSVFAVRLIDPLSKELSPTGINDVGKVAVGNTAELIFSKELTDKYDSLKLVSNLPDGFNYWVENQLESIKLFISVPESASPGDYPMSMVLSGSGRNDLVSLSLSVVKDDPTASGVAKYLDVSLANIAEQSTSVDSPAQYQMFFINHTDADAVFVLSPDLPPNWLSMGFAGALDKPSSFTVVVPKGQSVEAGFSVYPRLEGKKAFTANVHYEGLDKQFQFSIDAKPTLKSKLEGIFYGLPFYSFSLMPSYFANGLVSFFVK